mmetsp:Transcript_10403/g.22212  ORF Transcript_10403/g.22212 Transcript_10403/m.22212 type:complete len:81 (-) Transcript_10403:95-337(-)
MCNWFIVGFSSSSSSICLLSIYLFVVGKDLYPPPSLLLVASIIKSEKKEKQVLFACYLSSVVFLGAPIKESRCRVVVIAD